MYREKIERPVFIVSTPRSGSTLLFETLAKSRGAYTIGGESHGLMEGMPALHPAAGGWSSNRLTASDAVPEVVEELSRRFYVSLRDRDGEPPGGPARMIEKTPKNSLRLPFFDKAYPDSNFIYLYRDVRQTLSSMIEAWRSGKLRTYPRLPDWTAMPWSMLLIPGWRNLQKLPLPQIVAHQWAVTTEILLDDLEQIRPERIRKLSYDAFLSAPQETARALSESLGFDWDVELGDRLPLSATVVSAPRPDKWRAIAPGIESVWPLVRAADERALQFLG
jgi:hypothetical protein